MTKTCPDCLFPIARDGDLTHEGKCRRALAAQYMLSRAAGQTECETRTIARLRSELEAKEAELAKAREAWPPMRPTETAPFRGHFLFATANGVVHKGFRFVTSGAFWPIESEDTLHPVTFHADQVLGWWPLPEVGILAQGKAPKA